MGKKYVKEYDYINLTRGENHVLTVIKKDGTTFSFHWGVSGHTLISGNLEKLKSSVINFVKNDCHILYTLNTDTYESARICYNKNFKQWQLTINEKEHIYFHDCDDIEEAKLLAENFINVKKWVHGIAPTGIDVWKAIF